MTTRVQRARFIGIGGELRKTFESNAWSFFVQEPWKQAKCFSPIQILNSPEVSLERLIAQGLLTSNDVSGFAGMKVSVTLGVDPQNLRQVLMRARLPDGTEIAALNDGSVQQMRR